MLRVYRALLIFLSVCGYIGLRYISTAAITVLSGPPLALNLLGVSIRLAVRPDVLSRLRHNTGICLSVMQCGGPSVQ